MSKPRVLVLLAAYQGAPWIVEQIASILDQRDTDVRVDIGDDLSSDGSRDLVAAHFRDEPRVNFTTWPVRSGSAGGNFRNLIRSATAWDVDYVAFSDQDDVWHPRKLTTAIERLRSSGCQAYSSAVDAVWSTGRTRKLLQEGRQRAADFLFEGAGQGCTFVMTQTFFVRLKKLVTTHAEESARMHYHDWMAYVAARATHASWYFDPESNMAYRQHDANELGARSGLGSFNRRVAKIREGWFKEQIHAALQLYRVAGGNDARVERFGRLFGSASSLRRRIAMAVFVLRHGRRKLADRCILALASLAGWL